MRDDRYVGAPVLAVFDNLLPDSGAIRRRLVERVGAQGDDAYSLLAAIGRDCVGALQFLPADEGLQPPGPVQADALSDAQIAEILGSLASAPLGLREDQPFRISLAGAQEKTALLRQDGEGLLPRGTTRTTHILKLQIGHIPDGVDLTNSVENEYLCMKLTKAAGLAVAEVEIAEFGGQRVLVVERFDRSSSRKSPAATGQRARRHFPVDGGGGCQRVRRLTR